MRRLLLPITAVAWLAVATSATATTWCVKAPTGCSGEAVSSLTAALQRADTADADATADGADGVPDKIVLAAGAYTANTAGESTGFFIPLGADPIDIAGAGQGSTTLSRQFSDDGDPDNDNVAVLFLRGISGNVHDLTVTLPLAYPDTGALVSSEGGALDDDTLERVTLVTENPGTSGLATDGGATVRDTTITVNRASALGKAVTIAHNTGEAGRLLIEDSALSGHDGITEGGVVDAVARSLVVRRSTIVATNAAVNSDQHDVTIESSVIRIDEPTSPSGAAGGVNILSSGARAGSLVMDGVTLIREAGGGTPGVRVDSAANSQGVTATITNSIIRGFAPALLAKDESGGAGTASMTIQYSDTTGAYSVAGDGTRSITPGAGMSTSVAAPGFVNAAAHDFHLTSASPFLDKGDPAVGGPATDRDTTPRVSDGDQNGSAIRDIGAYELQAPQPLTVIVGGTGSGTVVSDVTGIACPSACSASYPFGASVTLTPTPASGHTFAGWSGACTGTGACVVPMTAARAVTAVFGAPAPPQPPTPPTPLPPAPPVGQPTLSRVSIAAVKRGQAGRLKVTSNAAADLSVQVERARSGRRQGTRCTAKGTGKRCTRYTKVRTLRGSLKEGANTIRIPATATGGSRLAAGAYRLTVRASTAAGARAITLRWTVRRG